MFECTKDIEKEKLGHVNVHRAIEAANEEF